MLSTMEDQRKTNFIIVALPAQSHVNPAMEFANRLLGADTHVCHVTLVTSVSGGRRVEKGYVPQGLDIATFSDGYDNGYHTSDGDAMEYMSNFKKSGSNFLGKIVEKSREGKPVTCLVYTLLLPWVAEVAREYHVPSALLWIQPAAVFDVYYYYLRGYGEVIKECENDPSWSLNLPNLPFTLKKNDLPSFLLPSTPLPYTFGIISFLEQIEELEKEETPIILANTIEALEVEALKAIDRFTLIPVGPLLPLRNPADDVITSSAGDSLKNKDYMKWVDTHEKSKVIYVSFGTLTVLSREQQIEVAHALLLTHRPYLWVTGTNDKNDDLPKLDQTNDDEELKKLGRMIPWCSQVEVLAHPSIGCFFTHCGWNSTLESITSGVPMVAFPQWTDQMTNAKLVEDLWKIGVRVNKCEEEGLVKAEEIKRCLEVVMESEEIIENAKNLKKLTDDAAKQGGGSDKNIKNFIEEVTSRQQTNSKVSTS